MNPYKPHDEIILRTKSQTRKGRIYEVCFVLDVAKGKSMFMLSSDTDEVLIEPIEYQHNKSNFELIDSKIKELNIKDSLTVLPLG